MGLGLSDEDEYADMDLPLVHVEFREIELQRQVRGRDTGDQSLERIEIWWWCNRHSYGACRYLRPFSVSVLFRKLAHLFWGCGQITAVVHLPTASSGRWPSSPFGGSMSELMLRILSPCSSLIHSLHSPMAIAKPTGF